MSASVSQQLCLGLSAAELAGLFPWLEEVGLALGMAPGALARLHVAVEEAVMNVAMHAYKPGVEGKVWLTMARVDESVVVSVEDEGTPFDAAAAPGRPAPKSLQDAPVGGLGLKLLHHYCPAMSYTRRGGRNHLVLPFALG